MLATLDARDTEALIASLRAAPALCQVGAIEDAVRETLPAEHRAQAEPLVSALMSLSGRLRDVPLVRVAQVVSDSPDLELDADARQSLRERLLEIVQLPSVSSTASAVELLTQNERNYRTARILTDVRHVFADDAMERPIGAVIIEVLAIQTWNRDGEEETVHIAMDETDLRELQGATKRALDKTSNLKGMLAQQDIPYFELDKR